jgi:hypothetical protein
VLNLIQNSSALFVHTIGKTPATKMVNLVVVRLPLMHMQLLDEIVNHLIGLLNAGDVHLLDFAAENINLSFNACN